MRSSFPVAILVCILFAGFLFAQKQKNPVGKPEAERVEMTLHDFMKDYTKPAMRYFKKTGDRKYLQQLLPTFPSMAPKENREDWQKIVDRHLQEGNPESSCKSCHDLYKKEYKKMYRKREIFVPLEIAGINAEIRSLLR